MPMMIEKMGWAERLGHIGETGLGIVLAAMPVALWIAWTPALLAWVVLVAILSAALLVLLADFLPQRAHNQRGARRAIDRVNVPEEIVEEVHRLFPLIYHHSGRKNSRYRQAMEKLSGLIEGPERGETPR